MDAPEDKDIWVSRNSSELLAELSECIPQLIYRRHKADSFPRPRTGLSGAALSHITRLLDLFQEWPQLLDPRLDALVGPLNNAFLEALKVTKGQYAILHLRKEQKICFPQAVSIILYSLCKVRGSKVIVRFLSNEARYLEPILEALEVWTSVTKERLPQYRPVSWEERYVLLLWLSHLSLTPFDLSSVGSDAVSHVRSSELEDLKLPEELPVLSQRLILIALENISSASKERESAILVLVRLGLRPDMRRLGLHKVLVYWATSQLKASKKSKKEAGYLFLGLLSFLAAFVKSADSLVIAPFLLHIFNSVEQLGILQSGSSSALTRKAVVKIYSACSITALSLEEHPDENLHFTAHILEIVIDELLTALEDNDTPVRQSASKALSVIAVKLDTAMAADISEVIIKNLEENVLWEAVPQAFQVGEANHITKQRNLSLVNPSKWQGLILTLSQLLFRRCPPVTQLPEVLNCLILALSFEQRSATGASLGTSVRDAACFGIWALARRYSTAELLAVDTAAIPAAKERTSRGGVIQLLAIELLVTATIDPAGNIRRGASAALQELIGRHPDTVLHGIPLVQIVDYHAIALRSRAMQEVAVNAARLEEQYWKAIQHELTTWRGIGASDVESRRSAAETLGILSLINGWESLDFTRNILWLSLNALDCGTVQKRQGFLLSIAALIRATTDIAEPYKSRARDFVTEFWGLFNSGDILREDELVTHTARPELITEAVSLLILQLVTCVKNHPEVQPPNTIVLRKCFKYLGYALDRRESAVLQHAIKAFKGLFEIAEKDDQDNWLQQIFSRTKQQEGSAGGVYAGYILALGALQTSSTLNIAAKERILEHLAECILSSQDIDARVVSLQGLIKVISGSTRNKPLPEIVVKAIQIALQDYTTDQRGDVGSLLRLEAINAVTTAFEQGNLPATEVGMSLLQSVCILAGEKLDKVRVRAWMCLTTCWKLDDRSTQKGDFPPYNTSFTNSGEGNINDGVDVKSFSSVSYYQQLLELFGYPTLRTPILQGIFGSTGGGSETILVASRQALAGWLQCGLPEKTLEAFGSCVEEILSRSLTNDRISLPALETLAFILQTNTFTRHAALSFRWRKLFVLVQKMHFKTTNIAKLLAAVDVYAELGKIDLVRHDVVKKLVSLLIHPFPRVRNAAADTLYLLTREGSLKPIDWADSTKFNKQALAIVKDALEVDG